MQKIKTYKIVQCKKCGKLQIMGGINFKCKYCHCQTKLRLKSKFGLHLKLIAHFDTGNEATLFLKKYQEEIYKNKFKGFSSYSGKVG